MKTLTLPLKKIWFDMIKKGIKKEEYRELSNYWIKRLLNCDERTLNFLWDTVSVIPYSTGALNLELNNLHLIKHFDQLIFTLGYPKSNDTERHIIFKNPQVRIGTGRKEWGAAPNKNYFVITWSI